MQPSRGGEHSEKRLGQFNAWRRQGAKLIGKYELRDVENFQKLVATQVRGLEPFMHATDGDEKKALQKCLEEIFVDALKLAHIFRTSQQIFTVSVVPRTYPDGTERHFDSDVMQVENCWSSAKPGPRSKVMLAISPMLTKTGDANGKNFDSFEVLAKPRVVTT